MALWKDSSTGAKQATAPAPVPVPAVASAEAVPTARFDAYAALESRPAPAANAAASERTPAREPRAESLIAPELSIEGKIEGTGHVRIAGRFKGDIDVRGDLTIEPGAKVTGSVRAEKVNIAGELVGNIEAASHVELVKSGALTGDLKAASLTVAAGSRMRGQADFGWDEASPGDGGRKGGHGSGADRGAGP